ncbi:MAG TPA: hypothetical protein O0X09_05295 [Methanocorpusculum sp.]|nr:hypothetical protein [Methanocorpusculum sp.]
MFDCWADAVKAASSEIATVKSFRFIAVLFFRNIRKKSVDSENWPQKSVTKQSASRDQYEESTMVDPTGTPDQVRQKAESDVLRGIQKKETPGPEYLS